MKSILELHHVSFSYGSHTPMVVDAVRDVSLTVGEGELFAFVGPDGAGKTTLIRLMCGILKPQRGSIRVAGFDSVREREALKHSIGYLSQKFSLYHDLTVDENIDFFAEIHHVNNYSARKEELLEFTRLAPYRNRLAGALSGGMKQKLALSCTLIHSPAIIFLDEPTTGVDPVSRRDFWKILLNLLKNNITIVVSTPYLDEAERCSRIALINNGRVLQCDTPQNVRSTFRYQVEEIVCSPVRRAAEVLRENVGKDRVQLFGDRLHLQFDRSRETVSSFLSLLHQHQIEVISHRELSPSLEDVFIAQLSSTRV